MNLIQWDCLEVMKRIPDSSIDAIITDHPYWTTACKNTNRNFIGIEMDKWYFDIATKRITKA